MLQKAASNAYSWWWASHVRTKQSKWLEQNLNDTEEKVTDMLKIIDHDGDTFAQRAEMYYSKRAELVSLIEEIFRSYRSMAGRFDHLSKNLQSANRTIASIFPDRVPYEMDDDDDDDPFHHDKPVTPKVKSLKDDFRGTPKKAVGFQASGLNKDEALKEIDKLQKEMLALQTEREFMKSSYEYGYKKFNEIENQITEKQKRVCLLQDEFGIESFIDDNEGRTIMVNQALKSCQESLDKLKEKHEQSTKEVREESRRIRLVNSKFEALRNKFNSLQMEKAKRVSSIAELDSMVYDIDNEANRGEDMEASDQQEKPKCIPSIAELDIEDDKREDMEPSDKQVSSTMEHDNMDYEIEYEEKEILAIEALRKEIEEKLQLGSKESLTMKQLVEKIDVLVKRVIRLETAVVSEKAQVKRLKSEADELQEQVRSLEEDKTATMEKRINELEAELSRVKDHVKTVVDQNNSLKANLTEAICNVNHLSVKLQEVEGTEFSQDVTTGSDAVAPNGTEEHELELIHSALKGTGTGFERKDKDVSAEGENIVDSDSSYKLDGDSGNDLELVGENKADKKDLSVDGDPENGPESVGESKADKKHSFVDSDSSYMHDGDSEKGPEPVGEDEADKKHLSETAGSVPDTEVSEAEANEEEEPNWKQLYLSGLDDGEKILLDEYSHALQNYKEVRKKLNEVDKKHRDAFFQLASQIHELKNVVALRDQVIQSLRQKLSSLEENKDVNLVEHEAIRLSTGQESDLTEAIKQSPIDQESAEKMGEHVMQVDPESRPHGILTVEDEIRSEIDDLLEENLEFWLRFSTSVHQIKKYQTSVKDLKAELSKLRGRKNQEGGRQQYMKSAARPIYFHLREIKTELTLWLENTEVLKDEVQDRHLTLCNFQDEIARVTTNARDHSGETGISVYQAAKFQGEVLIMNQEIKKVGEQLKSGFTSAGQLKQEIQRIMADLEKELWSSPSTTSQSQSRSWRPRIPLQSFLFGLKLRSKKKKKKSLQKQLSYIIEPKEPSE